jgi:uncharacterized protein YjiS (DUF1127 family)
MSDLVMSRMSGSGARPWTRARRLAGSPWRLVALMIARSRERQVLASLDRRMLKDIGLTPFEAGQEARKRFWEV